MSETASIVKAQSPLRERSTNTYFYPLTCYDQVVMPDGSRWDGTVQTQSVSSQLCYADLTIEGWSATSDGPGGYRQTVQLYNKDTDTALTSITRIDGPVGCEQVANFSTNALMQVVVNLINKGYVVANSTGTVTFYVEEQPVTEIIAALKVIT